MGNASPTRVHRYPGPAACTVQRCYVVQLIEDYVICTYYPDLSDSRQAALDRIKVDVSLDLKKFDVPPSVGDVVYVSLKQLNH